MFRGVRLQADSAGDVDPRTDRADEEPDGGVACFLRFVPRMEGVLNSASSVAGGTQNHPHGEWEPRPITGSIHGVPATLA